MYHGHGFVFSFSSGAGHALSAMPADSRLPGRDGDPADTSEITQCLGENQSEWVRSAACRGSLVLLVLSVLHVDTTPQRDPSLLALTLLIPSEKKRSFSLKEQFKRGGKQSLLILADDDTAH